MTSMMRTIHYLAVAVPAVGAVVMATTMKIMRSDCSGW